MLRQYGETAVTIWAETDLDGDGQVLGVETIIVYIVAIGAAVAAMFVLFTLLRAAYRFFRKATHFLDDWNGQEASGGHPGFPGIMARISSLEADRSAVSDVLAETNKTLSQLASDMGAVKSLMDAELARHGGTSTKDVAFEALRISREIQQQQEEEIVARREWQREYENDKAISRREWVAVFAAIRRMFGMPPDEQAKFWDAVTGMYAAGQVDELTRTAQPE